MVVPLRAPQSISPAHWSRVLEQAPGLEQTLSLEQAPSLEQAS